MVEDIQVESFEFREADDLERGRSPRRPGMSMVENGSSSVDVGDIRVNGAQMNQFDGSHMGTLEYQSH